MEVGIRELKQHLSEYLKKVEGGEIIQVTYRGRPKAIISPILSSDLLDKGIKEGWITPSRTRTLSNQKVRSDKSSLEVLLQDRDL